MHLFEPALGWYESNGTLVWVRLQVLMATNMKVAVFWNVVQCSLVDIETSETSVSTYQTTRYKIPDANHFNCLVLVWFFSSLF
jgi:hypothetical protein